MCEREIKIRHLAVNSDREICRQKAGRRRRKGRQREGMVKRVCVCVCERESEREE